MKGQRGASDTVSDALHRSGTRWLNEVLLWPWERPRGRGPGFAGVYLIALLPAAVLGGIGWRGIALRDGAFVWAIPLLVLGIAWALYVVAMIVTRQRRPVVHTAEAEQARRTGNERRRRFTHRRTA